MTLALFSRHAFGPAVLLAAGLLVTWPADSAAQASARIIVSHFSPPVPGPFIDRDPSHASLSASQGGFFDTGGSWSWLASSSANLARGSINGAVGVTTSGPGFGFVNAIGFISDQLRFNGTGMVEFTLAVHGSFRALAETGFHANGNLSFGNATAGGLLNYTANTPRFPDVTLTQTTGEARLISSQPSNAIAWFTARQTVTPNTPVPITANLSLDVFVRQTDVANANFLNTAQLWITMPQGMTFTSDSGVFLTDTATSSPVPEPQSWALMLAGMSALAMVARRRRRAT